MRLLDGLALAAILLMAIGKMARAQNEDRAVERARLVQQLANGTSTSGRPASAPAPSLLSGENGMPMATSRAAAENQRIANPKVLAAMNAVPRHLFVPRSSQRLAYDNRPLPVGFGQTISQPYIVALMTELLDPRPGDKVLEVGTGSGYQAAVLKQFTPEVYTIEIVEGLYRETLPRLRRFGFDERHVILGDGYRGLPQVAPFDRIIVTAAADHIPQPLIEQLRPGGRMVLPVGPEQGTKRLMLVEKDSSGKVRSRNVQLVNFVPLTRDAARGAEKK